jgi:hypothetical protein
MRLDFDAALELTDGAGGSAQGVLRAMLCSALGADVVSARLQAPGNGRLTVARGEVTAPVAERLRSLEIVYQGRIFTLMPDAPLTSHQNGCVSLVMRAQAGGAAVDLVLGEEP